MRLRREYQAGRSGNAEKPCHRQQQDRVPAQSGQSGCGREASGGHEERHDAGWELCVGLGVDELRQEGEKAHREIDIEAEAKNEEPGDRPIRCRSGSGIWASHNAGRWSQQQHGQGENGERDREDQKGIGPGDLAGEARGQQVRERKADRHHAAPKCEEGGSEPARGRAREVSWSGDHGQDIAGRFDRTGREEQARPRHGPEPRRADHHDQRTGLQGGHRAGPRDQASSRCGGDGDEDREHRGQPPGPDKPEPEISL
jgi:hypothetical protein